MNFRPAVAAYGHKVLFIVLEFVVKARGWRKVLNWLISGSKKGQWTLLAYGEDLDVRFKITWHRGIILSVC